MKFSIALGLLFAGLASSQQLEPFQAKVDSFLRENQHIRPTAKLISAKQNGSSSTVTYQDGPMSVKYQLKTENDQMKIVGIEQIVSFSTNMQFQPVSIQDVPQITNDLRLPPLPLIMPEFNIQSNGQLASRNVFDKVEREMEEMKRRMEKDQEKFQQMMEEKRIELQQRLRNSLNYDTRETPLIGAGNHDFNEATGVNIDQPLIGGGNHDPNRATQMMQNHPTLGGGDHDYVWMTVQIEPTKSLLGADSHDSNLQLIPQGQLIGSGEHDKWVQNPRQIEPSTIVGGHENWKVKKEKHQRKENYGRQRRHHSDISWTKKVFTAEEILPFLEQKLPDMMKNAKIVSIQNKGQVWRKGFPLDIQIKQKDGKMQNISVYFKPRTQQLLIDKISSIQSKESQNILPIQLETEAKAEKKQIPQEYLIAPKQDLNPSLLGEEQDPDRASQFTNLVKQIQFTKNNHIESKDQVIQVPLLGGEHDINHTVEQVKLLRGSSDPDNGEKEVEKEVHKNESGFDVTGLPLPGGETDVDHKIGLELSKAVSKDKVGQKIGLELIKKAIQMVKDIAEDEVQDIEDVEVSKTEEKVQKLQHLIK